MKLFPVRGAFLTGIESSDPFVEGRRRNQLFEAHNFYENWEKRLQNIHDIEIRWLRFGPPYSQTHIGKNTYDFSLIEKVVRKCSELGIALRISRIRPE